MTGVCLTGNLNLNVLAIVDSTNFNAEPLVQGHKSV